MDELIKRQSNGTSEPLKWGQFKSDNYLMRNLKKFTEIYAHLLKKEIIQAEKDIKKARKVFNG